MARLLFLSSTSLILLTGCPSDDTCGPGKAQEAGLLASSADVILNYGFLFSGPNNDCPDGTAPPGVISLTIQGAQVEGPGLLTFCVPRPDLLKKGPLKFGAVDGVRIIDLNGMVADCEYEFESLRPVTGDVTVSGLCDEDFTQGTGKMPKGYALTIEGALSFRRVCPTMNDTIAVTVAGTVAVEGRP